ncbi:MAG: alpha-mannosidase [Massiliimalia sp.]|jgi:alpha-mannosidase
MPFYFYHKERLARQIDQLARLRYRNLVTVPAFEVFEDSGENGVTAPDPQRHLKTMQLGEHWKGKDSYFWFCASAEIPQSIEGTCPIGIFDFGKTDMGSNGFESLLYLNGKRTQAVDQNHKEVFFDPSLEGKSCELSFRVWSGLDDGQVVWVEHQIRQAEIGLLDRATDEFYYMAKNIFDTMQELHDDEPDKTYLLNMVVEAFGKINFAKPGSEEFYASVREANDFLNETFDGSRKMDVDVTLIGHTHIDAAWLWRLTHTREKCARSFSTVNRLMELYPDYKFLQTQAQLYDYIKTDYPDLYEQIKQRVAEGRWEPAGAMWVECDCNLVSGESLVRQILYGTRFFEQEFGYHNDFLWLPDVFGYSWALPQILKQFGIKTFVTTKISWNDTNKLPYDTFRWRGIDGSEVLAHFITCPEHSDNRYYTYNGIIDPYMVRGVWSEYANKDVNTNLLIPYGYGDGGGGANRDMLENLRCIQKLPGLPRVKSQRAAEYFKTLNQTFEENARKGYVPVWDGELYLEFHRGTYTSQAYNKKTNRYLEFLMQTAETLCGLAMAAHHAEYPQQSFQEAWKIILRQQFHDVIPGSSIRQVYEDSHTEYAQAEEWILQNAAKAASCFTEPCKDAVTVFNPINWNRNTLVRIHNAQGKVFCDESGQVMPGYADGDTVLVQMPLQPLRFATLYAKPGEYSRTELEHKNTAETEFYRVEWNEKGHLVSVFDKEAQRELIPDGEEANVFQLFEDKPRQFDAWEMEISFENKMNQVETLKSVKAEETPLGIFVHFVWEYRDTTISQTMRLYHHTRRIDFVTDVDWKERETLMKVAFPLNIRATDARYDIQFGNIRRPITRNTSWEAAKYEVVGHKWAELSETHYGVALMNDCKYGYDIKEHTMRLTLLKSAAYPDATADYGKQEFTYSLYPHQGEWFDQNVEQVSADLNHGVFVLPETKALQPEEMVSFTSSMISLDALKKSEDGQDVIVRFHEFAGCRTSTDVCWNLPVAKWCETDLAENPVTPWQTGPIRVSVKPYELKTIRIVTEG